MPNNVLPDFPLPQWNWYEYIPLYLDVLMLMIYLIWRVRQKIAKRKLKKRIQKSIGMTEVESAIFDTLFGEEKDSISETLIYIAKEYKFDYEYRIRLSDAILDYYEKLGPYLQSVPEKAPRNRNLVEERVKLLFDYGGIPPRDEDVFIERGSSSFPTDTSKGNGRYYYARKISSSSIDYGDDLVLKFSDFIKERLGFSGKVYLDVLRQLSRLWFIQDHRTYGTYGVEKKALFKACQNQEETEKVISFLKFETLKEKTQFRLHEFNGCLFSSDLYSFNEKRLSLLDYDERLCKTLHQKKVEGEYLEKRVAFSLQSAFPDSKIWQGVYLNGQETDGVALIDGDLFIIECKADKFTPAMMEDEHKRNSAEKELKKASEQLWTRSQECLKKNEIRIETKKHKLIYSTKDPVRIYSFVVTQENLLGLSYLTQETARKLHFAFPVCVIPYDDLAFVMERGIRKESLDFLELSSTKDFFDDYGTGFYVIESQFDHFYGDVKNDIVRTSVFTSKMNDFFFSKEIEENEKGDTEVAKFFKKLVDSIPKEQPGFAKGILQAKNQFYSSTTSGEVRYKRILMDHYDLFLYPRLETGRSWIVASCESDGHFTLATTYDAYGERLIFIDRRC